MSEAIAAGGLEPGQVVDRYAVDGILGRGGMAVVYRVRHVQLGSFHALKVLTLHGSGIRDRLLLEGRVQASMHHPNVVAVTDVLDLGGTPGLVMEYIDGPALDRWLDDNQPTLDEVDAIFRAIVAGVAAAHDRGLVHRDLKPANVLLQPLPGGGFVPKVADFGLAKALADEDGGMKRTRSGVTMGTPQYMAPEQIRDAKSVDARADVFSLGCILYELVAGRPPFEGGDLLTVFNAVAAGQYRPIRDVVPDVPQRYVDAIEGCLRVDRDTRLPSCSALFEVFGGAAVSGFLPIPRPSGSMPATSAPPTSLGNATFVSEPSIAPESVPPTMSQPPTSRPESAPSLVTGRRVAVAAGVGGVGLAAAALIAVVGLGIVGVGGTLGYARYRAGAGETFAAEYDVTAASVSIHNREVVLADAAIGTGPSAWHVNRLAFVPGRGDERVRELRLEGLTGVIASNGAGFALPSTFAKLATGPLTIKDIAIGGVDLVVRTPAGDLGVSISDLALTDVTFGGAHAWRAATVHLDGLAVRAGDPVFTAKSIDVGADGIVRVEQPELTVRLRTDGLVDWPAVIADALPTWAGGTAAADTSIAKIAMPWLPIAVTRVESSGGNAHIVDRANAVKTATWDVAMTSATIGPRTEGSAPRLPFSVTGHVGDAPLSLDGDLRDDGLIRASLRVRELPLATFAPYVDASLRRHRVAIAGGTAAITVDLSVLEGVVAGDLAGEFADVGFAADGIVDNRSRVLLNARARSSVSAKVDGSLDDWSFAPIDAMFHAIADSMFAPVGRAEWRTVAERPSEPIPARIAPSAPQAAAPIAIAPVEPPPPVVEAPAGEEVPPTEEVLAVEAPPEPPPPAPPPPLTPAERLQQARAKAVKLNNDVRGALDDLKAPKPP